MTLVRQTRTFPTSRSKSSGAGGGGSAGIVSSSGLGEPKRRRSSAGSPGTLPTTKRSFPSASTS